MLTRLRTILSSVPVVTAVALFVLYLVGGFVALPALVKWQVEKQVVEKLGHRISIGDVHFNPLTFRFEVGDLMLSDPQGGAMLGFKRLLVDFELRSVIDRAWIFAQARLETPIVRVDIREDGRHNFSTLLDRMRDDEPEQASSRLPRFLVKHIALTDGRIELSDRLLDEPLVARVDPLLIEIDDLSSLPAQAARYRVSARNKAGESLETSGDLALNPVMVKGRLALSSIKVSTLARGLSRLLVLDTPVGQMDFAANFDVAVDPNGVISGTAHGIDFDVTALSVKAPGASAALVAVETLSLKQGRLDLGRHDVAFAAFRLANGKISASVDARGRLDWAKLVRVSAASARETAAAPPHGEQSATTPAPWRVSVANAEISGIAFGFADATRRHSASFAAVGLVTAPSAEFGADGTRVEFAKPKLSIAGARLDSSAESLAVPSARIEADQLAIVATKRRFELALAAPRVAARDGLAAKRGDASLELAGVTLQGGRIVLDVAGDALTSAIDNPNISAAGISFKTSADGAQLRDASLQGKRLVLQSGPSRLDLSSEKPRGALAELKMQRGADAVGVRSASIAGDKLSLVVIEGRTRIAGSAAQLSVSNLAARQGSERIAMQGASFAARTVIASAGTASPTASGVEARIEDATLHLESVGVVAQGASPELARVGRADLGAKSLILAIPEGPIDVSGDGLNAALADAVLRSPSAATELLRLDSATLSQGMLRVKDRVFTAEKLSLAGGKAQTWLDAHGRFNWLSLFRGTEAADAAAGKSPPSATPEWHIALNSAELDGYAMGFEDRRQSPTLAVGLEAIRASIAGFETGTSSPMQVDFSAKVASGGEIQAGGNVRADNGISNLNLRMTGVALAPLQTYMSEFAQLHLASGTVSSAGRLRYGDQAGTAAKLTYEGSVAVNRLSLEEVEPSQPFLAWDSLASSDVVLTLEPNRLDIGELRLDRPSARLIIAEDQTVNLTDVLKGSRESEGAQSASARKEAESASAILDDTPDDPFPVTIERLRLSGGALEFADLSLRPQFATRMHELKGVITGLGTDVNGSAKVRLDARVDKYGSAKIRGQISVHRPQKRTEIDMTFRNLEMTSLSPYVAKFAGYRIAAGRLALDLQYRVRNSKLQGKNKIVLNQVELGEKVDRPAAPDLPLELAIAILKDADGVIDIALPVSGDLDDPQFDYGAVIGKAIGNLLGGIAAAPFRALGALFGAGEKTLGAIAFDPGSDVIAPPERQKLAAVARVIKQRPALRLVVPPTYAGEDTPALKSLAVRTDIVQRMGVELAPGEDPGPIDTANPRVQRAVEAAFSQRYAPEVLAALKRRMVEAGASQSEKPPRSPLPAFYQGLVSRLIDEEPVSQDMLARLAARRGDAIMAELTTVGGVAATHVARGALRKTTDANKEAVTLRLELEATS